MNPKKLLIIVRDRFLATCYGEVLARANFNVSVALDGESGLQRLREIQPDAVIIDLMLPTMSCEEVIKTIRADKTARDLPIYGLPTDLENLAHASRGAGLTHLIERSTTHVATLVARIEAGFGINVVKSEQPHLTEELLARGGSEIAARIPVLRQCLQAATSPANPVPNFKELLQETHCFCEIASVLERQSIFQMASAIESLVYDLDSMPQQASASTLRTISQGIDFLGTLVHADLWRQTKAPGDSHVLVVDDDDNARQLITVAMQLVALNADSAATPEACLATLTSTAFDLIFLDVGLPGMSGFELCKEVRNLPLHKETPIVFLTGMATFQNRVQSSLCGGNDFIGKPFNLPEIGVKALLWAFKGQLALASKSAN